MKVSSVRLTALLCVLCCAALSAAQLWPRTSVRTADKNGDGRADTWSHFDSRGELIEVEVDSNFDGAPDIAEFYERGALVRRETDRNFNGQTDLVEEFDAQTHDRTRSVVDIDYDGTADLLVLFSDGRPVFSKRMPAPGTTNPVGPAAAARTADARLVRLIDPFESDTALRRTPAPENDDGGAGLLSSGGVSPPPIASVIAPDAVSPLAPRDGRVARTAARRSGSPRAPPVS
ncbi:MAG TPA: hypothetical protein VEU08_07020 [Vicinamibacterales bacterium]|nr:hypothetical protein [Vicinamibacterales bacterium]